MQYYESEVPPNECPICQDERSYLNWRGQQWTTLAELQSKGYKNVITETESNLYKLMTVPALAISQRAFIVRTDEGNLLWDCVSYIDQSTIDEVSRLGGIRAIAISHPHYYSSMVEWSQAFGNVPIYIHHLDRKWIMRKSPSEIVWNGSTRKLFGGLEMVHLGGHYAGGTVLHWPNGAGGKGVVLSADIIKSAEDRKWAAFMYSYPNMIPLPGRKVREMSDKICRYKFERLYSSFDGFEILSEARNAVKKSADRYNKFLKYSKKF